MKVYSIGREMGCDIVINDSSDVISRRHAILNVTSSGKMTIVDQSHNGTYVNGIRIAQNVPVPVTRKDSISFAHVARLDWNTVPKPTSLWPWVTIGIVLIALIVGGIFAYQHFTAPAQPTGNTLGDTIKTPAEEKKAEPKDTSSQKATPQTPQAPAKKSGKATGSKTGRSKGSPTSQKPQTPSNPSTSKPTSPAGSEGGRGMR